MLWLVLIIVIAIAFWFIVKKKQDRKRTRDGKDELITVEHIKDVYDHDLLDEEVGLMFT